jgi:outer membrane protein OmpA-like peptidoglycan-associated protein
MRTFFFSASLAAAALLAGCTTPRVSPAESRAVAEARTHRPAAAGCPALASPVSVGFAFGEGVLSELASPALASIASQLACHPDAAVLVVGLADGHGTAAEQHELAQTRTMAVAKDLQTRGVAAGRVQTQVEGAAPAGDAGRLVVLAEGRRW